MRYFLKLPVLTDKGKFTFDTPKSKYIIDTYRVINSDKTIANVDKKGCNVRTINQAISQ